MRILSRILSAMLIHPSRRADLFIGGEENPYLIRWFLIPRNRWFNVYLHNVKRSDDDRALHDHPWWSVSLMLRGQMDEVDERGQRTIRAGQWRYRSSTYAHRLCEPVGDTWTLFVTGRNRRSWGFHCPQGWRHWSVFTSSDGLTTGLGCGEYDGDPTQPLRMGNAETLRRREPR